MKKKLIYLVLALSLFVNIIFVANKLGGKDSYEKNITGYYTYMDALNYNFERDGKLFVDNGRDYVESSYEKITNNIYSFDFNGEDNLFIVEGSEYLVYLPKDKGLISLNKVSSKNITNTRLNKVKTLD